MKNLILTNEEARWLRGVMEAIKHANWADSDVDREQVRCSNSISDKLDEMKIGNWSKTRKRRIALDR